MRSPAALLTTSLLLAFALPAAAQQQPKLEPLPDAPPPPAMQADNPADEPQVTITRRGEDKVEEFRIRGKLYMVRVTPPHGVPYYLVDQRGDGSLARIDTLDPALSVPMWVIKSW